MVKVESTFEKPSLARGFYIKFWLDDIHNGVYIGAETLRDLPEIQVVNYLMAAVKRYCFDWNLTADDYACIAQDIAKEIKTWKASLNSLTLIPT
jgi:hypothetical protein